MSTSAASFESTANPGTTESGLAVDLEPTLRIKSLSKSFSGIAVLNSFSLTLGAGEIHVLVGQNGSGKSTLIKVLSGYHRPDEGGQVFVAGEELQFESPESAYRLGCRFVHQDLGLVQSRSVLDNLSLTSGFPTKWGTIRSRTAASAVSKALARAGLDIDPRRNVSDFSAAQRTGIALARAVREDPVFPPRLLVLDEPTASLPEHEVQQLLDMLKSIARSGISVLFVTHHLNEVFQIGDAVTVLRNGQRVGTHLVSQIQRQDLVEMLVGGEIADVRRRTSTAASNEVAPTLVVRSLSSINIRSASLSARPGEIVGIAGLTGSGSESILEAIFGSVSTTSGEVVVGGHPIPPGRPDISIRAGVGFLPPDRVVSGGVMSLSASENITLAKLRPYWRRWRLAKRREASVSKEWFERFSVSPRGAVERTLSTFSGGNQQKILLAKWMHAKPVVLLLNEPTQGVDVGAKAEIHGHILQAANEGLTVVVNSTDNEELATICDRVLVFRKGEIKDEISGERLTDSGISRSVVLDSGEQVGE